MDYPAPAHAAYIWLAGDTMWLAFPGTTGRGSAVHFPADEYGVKLLLLTLRERERARDLRIATPATPTQWDAEEVIKALKGRATRAKPSAEEIVLDLELD